MPLRLNLLPVQISRPSCTLPYVTVPKSKKPKQVFEDLYEPEAAARLVWRPNESHIVFLRGKAPEGFSHGKQIYEWTDSGGLPLSVIEYAVADYFRSRFQIVWQFIDRKQRGCCAFRDVEEPVYEHLAFQEGIYFRAEKAPKPGVSSLIVNWRARTLFAKNLDDDKMQAVAAGASVILVGQEWPEAAERYKGRYCGRVRQISDSTAQVELPNGERGNIPLSSLRLEAKPENFAAFDRAFPNLVPRIGTNTRRLQLDKTLVGHSRNQRLYRDRLEAAINFLFPSNLTTLTIAATVGNDVQVKIEAAPVHPCSDGNSYPFAYLLPQPDFIYKDDSKHSNRKKTDGLVKLGPYEQPSIESPVYGFLFANRHRPEARKLFSALRDGVGYFRGIQSWFGLPLKNDSVISIGDFDVEPAATDAETAGAYTKALQTWLSSSEVKPDIFFIVHDKTEQEDAISPYYACKALLLKHGVMTQNVTVDLIDNTSQFQWAASNIALGAFTKLGGIPWTLEPCSTRKSLIIGIGRAERCDPVSRARRRYQAFANCSCSDGRFGFVSVYPEVKEDDLAQSLGQAATAALEEAEKLKLPYDSLVIHLTGELKQEERIAVEAAAAAFKPTGGALVCVISVSEDSDIYAVTDDNPNGIPSRGQVIRLSESDFLVLTEGSEDLAAARFRTPCSVRVKTRSLPKGVDPLPLIAQVYDLSQVNFRAFNGASKPVSVLYSTLIARALRFEDIAEALKKNPKLNSRMWFL